MSPRLRPMARLLCWNRNPPGPLPSIAGAGGFIWFSSAPIAAGRGGRQGARRNPHTFTGTSHTSRGLLVVCTIQLLIFAVVLGLALVASRASRDDLLLRWRHGFWPVPLGVGYSVAIRLALFIIMMAAGLALIVTHVMTANPSGNLSPPIVPTWKPLLIFRHAPESALFLAHVDRGEFWRGRCAKNFGVRISGRFAVTLAATFWFTRGSDCRRRHRGHCVWLWTPRHGTAGGSVRGLIG